ncbi:hypothetical protein ABI59_16195 [Acidobacteria bacterium Mor1]|nr:hypothetical protein ABI59_16195 [Acidobacteria bacterium Mor1]
MVRTAAALLLLTTVLPVWASDSADIRSSRVQGVVRDAAGQPVAGVSVSFQWRFDAKGATPLFDEAVTDKEGRFSVAVVFPLGKRPVALLALDRDRKRGSLVEAYSGRPVEMTLEPLRTVTATLVGTETGEKVSAEIAVYSGEAKPRFAWILAPKGDVRVALPSGDMWYGVKSDGRVEVRALLNLESADTPYAIGSIPLDPVGSDFSGN